MKTKSRWQGMILTTARNSTTRLPWADRVARRRCRERAES